MKNVMLFAVVAVSFLSSGCMSGYTTVRHERRQMIEVDSLAPPPMMINDVIALAQDSVGDDVIISQIAATDSYFRLTNDDILALKKAGVSDKVINAMIKSGDRPVRKRTIRYPAYYPYWGYYWNPYRWYPWYSPGYVGLSYRWGFSGGSHYVAPRTVRNHR